MGKCTKVRVDDTGDGDGESEFPNDLNFPIKRYHFDSCKERLRGLFNQVLVAFLREKYGCKSIRPIPVLCGNGRPVDLFKLFWVVRKIGGYDAVSNNSLWGFVLDECGLFRGLVPSVKLIYMQYLSQFDQWLGQGYGERNFEDRKNIFKALDSFYQDLKTKFRSMNMDRDMEKVSSSLDGSERALHPSPNLKGNGAIEQSDSNSEKLRTSDDFQTLAKRGSEKKIFNLCGDDEKSCVENDFDTLTMNVVKEKAMNEENGFCMEQSDDRGKLCDKDRDKSIVLAKKVTEINKNMVTSRKRKRKSQSWIGMLNWLKNAAKKSDDASIGKLPESNNWNGYGNNEPWMQALLVRNSLLIRRNTNANAVEDLLKDHNKKPQMHPSMYEDDVLHHNSGKTLRSSQKSSNKAHLCSCCYSREDHESRLTIPHETNIKRSQKSTPETSVKIADNHSSISNDDKSSSINLPPEKSISIGPEFQAEIPEWTGFISESDPKWLGKKQWPLENDDKSSILALDPIGTGRQSSCDCPFLNSVECVRFHIAEKRLSLKRELGSVFHHWGFNRMGEETSLSWTAEEETRFKDMVRSCGALSKKFWHDASKFLSSKTRQRVATYYFNVYLVRRRSYQNRVTPKDIDSDDDEQECGLIGESFGYKALYYRGSSRLVSCTLNTQAIEF